ncbi:MAG TPA: hypothetical protein PKM88_14330, partial [bacterium]|nr:hypothetical protein [bacterium]
MFWKNEVVSVLPPTRNTMRHDFSAGGHHCYLVKLLLVIHHRLRFVRLPVNFQQRIGLSTVTSRRGATFVLACQILLYPLHFLNAPQK